MNIKALGIDLPYEFVKQVIVSKTEKEPVKLKPYRIDKNHDCFTNKKL